jgi:hypothetical protein
MINKNLKKGRTPKFVLLVDYRLDGQGSIPSTGKISLFSTASKPASGPTQPSIQWVLGAFSLGMKQLGREADNSPPSSAKVMNGAIPPLPHVFMA